MRGLIGAFMAESALIAWRNLHNEKTLPPPSQFTGAAIIFALLGLAPDSWSTATTALGWAIVLGTFLNLYNPNAPLNLTSTAAQPTTGGPAPGGTSGLLPAGTPAGQGATTTAPGSISVNQFPGGQGPLPGGGSL